MRDFIQLFLRCVEFFFILYMVGYASFLFLSVTVGSSTLYAAKRRNALKNELSNDYYVPVSVIVPAYNEEVTIEATILSCSRWITGCMRSSSWMMVPLTGQARRSSMHLACGA